MNVNPQQDLVITATVQSQKLLDRIPHLAWLMTDRGQMVAINQHWCEYAGKCDLIDDKFWRIATTVVSGDTPTTGLEQYPPSFEDSLQVGDRARFAIAWAAARRWQTPLTIKLQFKGVADWEWFDLELEPDGDESGTIWICTATRLGGKSAIPASQPAQFLEALLDYASDGIVACDAAGRLVLFNRMAQEFHGLPPEPLAPEEWARYYDLYDGDGLRTLEQAEIPLFRALQGEKVVGQEMTIKPTQGAARSLVANATAIYNSMTGEKLGAVALMRDITASKQAQAERLRAELYSERLSIGLRIAKAAGGTWDLATNRIFWSPEFDTLFDYEPSGEQRSYQDWIDRVHPDDLERVQAQLQQTIDLRSPEYRCEYRIVWRDGQIRWIDSAGQLQIDAAGNPQTMTGLVYDITDRKRNEEAVRHNEEFIRRILESNQDCIKVLDTEGRLLYMNNVGQSLLEIDDFATIANNSWLELWKGDEAQKIENALAMAQGGNIDRFEGYCPTAKGVPKWWEVIVAPILDADGKVEQILSVSRDITERRQTALALQASEELLRYTFEHTAIGFCHVALDGTWLRVNQKLCQIVGYSQTELLSTTFQAITEAADLAEDLALVNQLLDGEIREYILEKRYIHKQGHRVWVNITVSLICDRDLDGNRGTPQYFVAAVQDISDRKQLESLTHAQTADLQRLNSSLILAQHQLEQRNHELDAFVYMVAHDLKAPLRSIANLSEWIEEDLIDRIEGDERQQFELLRQRVKRMDALIDGLLRYSRVGSQELERETVDVTQLVADTIDSLDLPANFRIESSSLPTLAAKRILLAQIFANLISNAIKHHDRSEGLIEIGVVDLGSQYQFSIGDDGPGIPPGAARERIFEMFQTLKPSISTENTGIGLAMVKKIVEGEGGRIWLDLDRARGACFCFTWPK